LQLPKRLHVENDVSSLDLAGIRAIAGLDLDLADLNSIRLLLLASA
jgi:hypothetical protein